MDRKWQQTPISHRLIWLSVAIWLLAACSSPALPTQTAVSATNQPASQPTTSSQRTLVPTFTPVSSATPRPTQTAVRATQAATPTATPVNFDQTVVELRYTIPSLGLDRRLEGKLGGEMIVADEATGIILQRSSQGNIVAELRQFLPTVTLDPVPEGCNTCVKLSFSLPADNIAAEGWLQDKRLLGSVENYMWSVLGPHFPPQTAVGLHRAPSPYAPAHSIALTQDGRFWVWLATDAQIAQPSIAPPALQLALDQLDAATLAASYEVDCLGNATAELLQLGEQPITIRCPEFSLPTSLQPLYLALDAAVAPWLANTDAPQRPTAVFPLPAVVDYRRADDSRLTLFYDGRLTAVIASTTITSTLPLTQTNSLVATLLDSGELALGLATFSTDNEAITHRLLVRGVDGVYDGAWETAVSLLAPLDNLLAELSTTPEPTPTIAPTETAVP